MKQFLANLLLSSDIVQNEVLVKTSDADFGRAMMDHLNDFTKGQRRLSLKTETGLQMIKPDEIVFFEVFQRDVTIHQQQAVITVRISLSKLLNSLDPKYFLQISKSTVINLNHLKRLELAFSGNYYAFVGDTRLVISRRYIGNLKKNLTIIGGDENEIS